jgi:hypothetical protein
MAARLQLCHQQGNVTGTVGFESNAHIAAVLFPDLPQNQPLAIGFVYEPCEQIDPSALLQTLTEAVTRCVNGPAPATVQPLFDDPGLAVSAARLPMARMSMPTAMLPNRWAAVSGDRPHG